MRSPVFSVRFEVLLRTTAVGLVASTLAACSTDFTRFSSVYEDAAPKGAMASRSNPAGVDPVTTASVDRRVVPVGEIGAAATPRATYHQPEPTYVAPSSGYGGQAAGNAPVYQTPATRAPTVSRSSLPALRAGAYEKPRERSQTDPIATGSVEPLQEDFSVPEAPRSNAPKIVPVRKPLDEADAPARQSVQNAQAKNPPVDGWNSAGGTQIRMQSGETLYNLSRRYGVPVKAIMAANSIADPDSVQAGQTIVIPTYVYSDRAPVSAPDSNPKTAAARASVGMRGEATPSRAPQPQQKPIELSAVSPIDSGTGTPSKETKPRMQAAPPTIKESTPDYSVVTGSVAPSGTYTVRSGDSLSRIASLYNTSVDKLVAANGLSTSSLKIGQVLTIPDSSYSVVDASSPVNAQPTFSTPKPQAEPRQTGPKPYVKPTVQATEKASNIDKTEVGSIASKKGKDVPKSTGITTFRWPVKGRVITKFGDRDNGQANDGVDISVPEGTAVKAAENGEVIYVGDEITSYGNLVLVRHEDGWVSAYAHAKSFEVSKGDKVRRGQTIARSGRTGDTNVPKLHFELRKNANPVDPLKHLGG